MMPIIGTPFLRVSVDLIGPIHPPTDDGNRFILTLIDYATRYPKAKTLKKTDTETMAEALVEIYSVVGIPREILSDKGKQFTSDLMKEVGRFLSINQLTTTPNHPTCNGLVERLNDTLKTMLRRECEENLNSGTGISLHYFLHIGILYRKVQGFPLSSCNMAGR